MPVMEAALWSEPNQDGSVADRVYRQPVVVGLNDKHVQFVPADPIDVVGGQYRVLGRVDAKIQAMTVRRFPLQSTASYDEKRLPSDDLPQRLRRNAAQELVCQA